MSSEVFRPSFYYGRAERASRGKTGYQLCLVDLRSGVFAWFRYRRQLADKIRELISPVPAESERHYFSRLPKKKFTREVPAEDYEDLLWEEDELAERGREDDAFDFCSGTAIRKDHLKNFSMSELNWLFAEDRLPQIAAEEESFSSGSMREYFPPDSIDEIVCCQRELNEIEPEQGVSGPYYWEIDFTSDINQIPEKIARNHRFLDVAALAAQSRAAKEDYVAIEEEVMAVFHPEKAAVIKKSHGLAGIANTESPEQDVSCRQIELNL